MQAQYWQQDWWKNINIRVAKARIDGIWLPVKDSVSINFQCGVINCMYQDFFWLRCCSVINEVKVKYRFCTKLWDYSLLVVHTSYVVRVQNYDLFVSITVPGRSNDNEAALQKTSWLDFVERADDHAHSNEVFPLSSSYTTTTL